MLCVRTLQRLIIEEEKIKVLMGRCFISNISSGQLGVACVEKDAKAVSGSSGKEKPD